MLRRQTLAAAISVSFIAYIQPTLSQRVVLSPTSWAYIGPFPMGKTEFDGDPLARHGGARQLFAQFEANGGANAKRKDRQRFLSELATGGYVGWSILPSTVDGSVVLQPERVNWNQLVQGLSGRSVLEFSWLSDMPRLPQLAATWRGV